MMTLYFEPTVLIEVVEKEFANKSDFFALLSQSKIFWLAEPTQEERKKLAYINQINPFIDLINGVLSDIITHQLHVNTHKNSIFFLSKTQTECKELREEYGLLFVSREKIFETMTYFFNHDLQNITKNANWADVFKNYIHPCNAMIITDNYFYEKSIDSIQNGKVVLKQNSLLTKVLPNLVQNGRKDKFHLTIITEANPKYRANKQAFCDALKEIFKDKFSFEIIFNHTQTTFHDRILLTNYGFLTSGHGFDMTSIHDTYLVYYPLTYIHNFKSLSKIEAGSETNRTPTNGKLSIFVRKTLDKIKKVCEEIGEGEYRASNEVFQNRLL